MHALVLVNINLHTKFEVQLHLPKIWLWPQNCSNSRSRAVAHTCTNTNPIILTLTLLTRLKVCAWPTITRISYRANPRDALHHGERAVNKIRWTLSVISLHWKSPIFSYRTCIWPTPSVFGASVGVTPLEFCRGFRHQKTESLGYHVALFVWSYV